MTDERRAKAQDKVDQLIIDLTPAVRALLERVEADEFTTTQFIDVILVDPSTAAVYHQALEDWGENEKRSKMVVHGQVLPAAMRASGLVEWIGYAHGEDDTYAVPSWWKLKAGPPGA